MRNRTMRQSLGILTILLVFVWAASFAAEHPDKSKGGKNTVAKGTAGLSWAVLTINNLWTWHRSDGEANHSPGGEDGMGYPAFTARAIYEDNMVFGGKMFTGGFEGTGTPATQVVRVNGGSYLSNHGMLQGWVTGSGPSANYLSSTSDPLARIFRIRRDWTEMSPADLKRDASIVNEQLSAVGATQSMMDAVVDAYAKDWDEWPTQYGAPYIDRNGNGVYDKPPVFSSIPTSPFTVDSLISGNYDEPGVAGADLTTPADQVLYTVYNGLDRTKALKFEGSDPIGLEVQKTVWGYKRTDALGNVYFTRYRLINKGGVDIGGGTKGTFYLDSMYLCQWSDVDLGNAGDDVAGSDSVLSMGYVYNGNATDRNYAAFNLAPPSSGYDFLGGPLVDAPGDSAIFGFKKIYGKHNLGMSSFSYFSAGSPYADPPFEEYDRGTGRWWALLRGYAPVGGILDPPTPFNHPPGAAITKFPFSGDPSLPGSATNFIDGLGTSYSFSPGDRRILENTGPFRMAPGDTQDVYMGFVVGIGGDRLSSVAVMKAYDKACQETFDLVFQVAKAPKNPEVKVTELDGELILDWSENTATIGDTEGRIVNPGAYTFEGYNLYQFPSVGADASTAVKIATYDISNGFKTISDQVFDPVIGQFTLKPVQLGSDAGVHRIVTIDQDYVLDIPKLYNGQEYYFAVTAYSRATLSGYTAALESAPNIITVRPHGPSYGTRISMKADEVVTATLVAGESDVKTMDVVVVNPAETKTATWQIGFFDSSGATWWKMTDKATGVEAIRSDNLGSILTGDPNSDYEYPKKFGVVPHVGTLTPDIRADSSRFLDTLGANIFVVGRFSGGPSWNDRVTIGEDGSTYLGNFASGFNMGLLKRIEVRFGVPSKAYRLRRTGPGTSYVLQTTVRPNAPAGEVFVNVPFSVYEVSGPSGTGGRQLTVSWRDQKDDGYWNPDQGGDGLEILFIHNRTYDLLGQQFTYPGNPAGGALNGAVIANELTVGTVSNPNDIAYLVSVGFSPAAVATGSPLPAFTATTMYIRPVLGLNSTLTYEFVTQGSSFDQSLVKKDAAAKVGVFPNPYYTQNRAEFDRYDKFVTFNNLPPKTTIKIFNLAGHLVRTLEKNDASSFLRWNLVNEKRFPVASGIYICYVDLPDVGVTKVLKLAVIQEQEILDIF